MIVHRLHIDIETYSPESLADAGLYRYAEHPESEILLFAYGIDDEPTQIIDLASGEQMPDWLVKALTSAAYVKHAHNAAFERVWLSIWLRRRGILGKDEWLDASQWRCSMVLCARAGLPLSLDQAGRALGLPEQKMAEGKALIKLFCKPKDNKDGSLDFCAKRNLPDDYPGEWDTFKRYCVRDVEVERSIVSALSWVEVPEDEQWLYAKDQEINDRGIVVNHQLVANALNMDAKYKATLNAEAQAITGCPNPNSRVQLSSWLADKLGTPVNTLTKADVTSLLGNVSKGTDIYRVLKIRQEMAKTSCSKYKAIAESVCADGRVRGLYQFHGARTGRWAGRLVQMQNLPQNHITDLDFARQAVLDNDMQLLALTYGNVPDTLSQLIRTAFVARPGYTLAVCDFSAIEARVVAWLAGENWVLDVFRQGGDIYCATASQMFGVPVEKHGRNAELRQKGKIAVLALGYGGSVGALEAMGGAKLGLTRVEMQEIVTKWRRANANIVQLWRDLETAVRKVLAQEGGQCVRGLLIDMHEDNLIIHLPSGRCIVYPRMSTDWEQGHNELCYWGNDQKSGTYCQIKTHGGKLTENVVQAIARDCLAEVLLKAPMVVGHIHDEIIAEVPEGEAADAALNTIKDIFARTPEWAPGLPLKGAGYITPYYKKD